MERKLFGTDGIRGQANSHPVTPEIALNLGKALGKIYVTSQHGAVMLQYGLPCAVAQRGLAAVKSLPVCSSAASHSPVVCVRKSRIIL